MADEKNTVVYEFFKKTDSKYKVIPCVSSIIQDICSTNVKFLEKLNADEEILKETSLRKILSGLPVPRRIESFISWIKKNNKTFDVYSAECYAKSGKKMVALRQKSKYKKVSDLAKKTGYKDCEIEWMEKGKPISLGMAKKILQALT